MSFCVVFTVQFSNGSIKTTDKLDFTMYKNTDEINPRKKLRRLLVRNKRRFICHNLVAQPYQDLIYLCALMTLVLLSSL